MTGTVYVVDDDAAVRDAVALLLRSVGLHAVACGSAAELLERLPLPPPACLVLDVRMPQMSGLELQRLLREAGVRAPVIFITGHGDVPMAVAAMKAGAFDFLQKPFHDQQLIDCVQRALHAAAQSAAAEADRREVRERLGLLTERERQVLERVVHGCANKVIAAELGLSERTVEIHRAHVMNKMQARNVADLVRMTLKSRDS